MRSTVSVEEVVQSALRNNISGGVDLIGKLAMGSFVVSNIEMGTTTVMVFGILSPIIFSDEKGEYKKVCVPL